MRGYDALERVQRYVIARRQVTCTATVVGPFTVLLQPDDDTIESNLAIPHTPDVGAPETWRDPVRAAFAAQDRRPAVQWLAGYAPQVEAALQSAGFTEHARETLMVCAPETLRPTPPIPGLSVTTITDTSSLAETRENLDANEYGFDSANAQPATDEQAAQFRATLTTARAFTVRRNGRAVAAGMHTMPLSGVTELAGIATLAPYRGQGIATALTAYMTQAAFANGCDLVYLKTTTPVAARVYTRVGFQPVGDELVYVANE